MLALLLALAAAPATTAEHGSVVHLPAYEKIEVPEELAGGARQRRRLGVQRGGQPWSVGRIDRPGLPLEGKYNQLTGTGARGYVLNSTGVRTSHQEFGGPHPVPIATAVRPQPDAASVHTPVVEQLRSYLISVYPAEAPALRRLSGTGLVERFGALDYYYTCAPSMVLSLVPSTGGCVPISSRYSTSGSAPALPYLPAGAFYRAVEGAAALPLSAFMYSSWSRHPTPVEVLSEPLPAAGLARFQSSFGARVGPSPSWTNPNALVRYPLYPSGLDLAALSGIAPLERHPRPPRTAANSQSTSVGFDLSNHTKVASLLRLRDGDLLEVEQWGGPLYNSPECPPICGMWGNVYTGTGVFLRAARQQVTCANACVWLPCISSPPAASQDRYIVSACTCACTCTCGPSPVPAPIPPAGASVRVAQQGAGRRPDGAAARRAQHHGGVGARHRIASGKAGGRMSDHVPRRVGWAMPRRDAGHHAPLPQSGRCRRNHDAGH